MKPTRINESDSEEEDVILMHNNSARDQKEIERRISMIQDIDHEYRPSVKKQKEESVFKKAEQSVLIEEGEEAFNLNPNMQEAVFGGLNRTIDDLSINKKRDSQANGKVTIPIDWDYIIDQHIKNTNTNVTEANKTAQNVSSDDLDELLF